MSLGTRIMEALTGSGSSESAGKDTERVPGSFPTDDMSVSNPDQGLSSSGSQHNKLHKPDDPRGWSESEETSPGHQHTDSGVGMTGSEHQQGAVAENDGPSTSTDIQRPKEDSFQPADKNDSTVDAGITSRTADGVTGDSLAPPQSGNSRVLDDGDDATAVTAGEDSTTEGAESSKLAGERDIAGGEGTEPELPKDPYWGDIPRGTGVYNTVTGHGSPEDTQRRDGAPAESAQTGRDETEPGQSRSLPLSSPNVDAGDERNEPEDQRLKQGAAGAGILVGSGVAAHEFDKAGTDSDQHPVDRSANDDDAGVVSQPEEQKESKIAGLFRRSQKDDKETTHEGKKEEKAEKRLQHPKDDDHHALSAATTAAREDERQEVLPEDRPDQQDGKRQKDKDDATAAAVAAFTAHAAAEDRNKKEQNVNPTEPEQPKEKKENKLFGVFHRGSKDKDEKPQEEKSVKGASHNKQEDTAIVPVPMDEPSRAPPVRSEPPAATTQPDSRAPRDDLAPQKDSNLGPEVAAAGLGGAAAYGASKEATREEQGKATPSNEAETSAASDPSPAQGVFPVPPADSDVSGQYNSTASGTESGIKPNDDTIASPRRTDQSQFDTPAQDEGHQDDKSAVAGAAAAGVGAVAYEEHKQDETPPPESHVPPTPPPKDDAVLPTTAPTQTYPTAGVAESAPGAEAPTEPAAAQRGTTGPDTLAPATRPSVDRSITPSHGGQYNVLGSGTASGVNIGPAPPASAD